MKSDFRKRFFFSLGFTLIEFTIVIAIITILAVILAPNSFLTSTYNQQLFYDSAVNNLRYARKLAIETGSHIQVDLTSNSMTLSRRTSILGCVNATVPLVNPQFRQAPFTITALGNVTLTFSADWPLYFNSLGQVFRASDCQPVTAISAGGIETLTISGAPSITLWGETGFSQ